jgi:hypothetical protein
VSNLNHVLPDISQLANEGEMLTIPKGNLQVNLQHLETRLVMRFSIKWKDYLEDEAS